MIDLTAIIQQINDQVDGHALARLIDYHPDKIQVTGNILKCFCPVHNERAFRSLIFDLKNKSFKCMMKHCACFDGGSFVHFWAIYRQLEPINAARDLVDRLQLSIDLSTLRQLAENYATEAQAALEVGDLTTAREKVDEALAVDPRNAELRLLSAQVWHEAGEVEKALAERLSLCNDQLAAGEISAMDELFAQLDRLHAGSLAVEEHRVRWARQTGEREPLSQALVRFAELAATGEPAHAIDALNEASALEPDNTVLMARLCELHEATGQATELQDTLQRWAAACERLGEQHSLLQVLERLAVLNPHDYSLPERIAHLQAELGSPEQARELWLNLANAHTAAGRYNEALTIIAKLTAATPDDVDLREQRARLLQLTGRAAEAIAAWRELAGLAREVGLNDRVNEYYDQARAIDPGDPGLREDQAAWKLACGDVEGGLAELFALAELFLENGDLPQGMTVLERIVMLAPTSLDKRLRVGRCLERNGLAEEAFASYARLVKDLLAQQQSDAGLAICEELKRLRPLEAQTLELRIEAHLTLKQKPEAIEACRETARAWLASGQAGNIEGAETALQRGIKLDRTETIAKIDLAHLYEETNRAAQAVPLWLEMALFHRAQAQPQAANEAIREALRLDPTNREAKQMLAEGLETAGAMPEALVIWRELADELLATDDDAMRAEAYRLLLHALELAPRDATLLERSARLALEIEDAKKSQPLVTRWLDAYAGQTSALPAIDAYRLAVRHYPNEAAWRARLAQMLLSAGEHDEAAENYEMLLGLYREQGVSAAQQSLILERLVSLRPERSDLRAEQAELMIAQGHGREAALLYQELADASLQHGNMEAGLDYLRQANTAEPENALLLTKFAELSERAGRTREALPLYEKLAELRRRETDRAGAATVLEKLLSYDPARLDLRAELAEIYEQDGDTDRAIEHNFKIAQVCAADPTQSMRVVSICRKVRALAPEFIPARELLIDGFLRLQEWEEAKLELDALGDLALNENQLERAEGYFKRVLEIDPNDIGSGERLGKLYEARGRMDEAAQAFEHVLRLYEGMSETARVISVLQKLKKLRPTDLNLRRRLARALPQSSADRQETGAEWLELLQLAIEQSDADMVLETLEEVRPLFKTDWVWRTQLGRMLSELNERGLALETWQALATDALELRELEVAREAAGEGLRLDGDAHALRELRIDANRRLSNYDSAAEDLKELAERAAGHGATAQAKQYLLHALELQPREPQLLDMLAEMEVTLGETEAATSTLRRLCEQHRGAANWEAALTRARRICALNPTEPEWQEYLAALLLDADRTAEALELWRGMAEDAAAAGRTEQALARYSRILEYLPGNIDTLRRLADLTYETGGMHLAMGHYDRLIDSLQAEGDATAIEAEYNRILELEPGHLQLKERYADFVREQGRQGEARELYLAIIAAYRDEREEPADAVRVLRRLKGLEPESLEVREQEATLLEMLGRNEEAARAWHELAELLRRAGRGPEAAQAVTRRAELLADHVETQREAAEFFEEYEDAERATHYYLRAIEILDRNEQLEPCVGILERAMRLNPMRLDLPDALARTLERLGQTQRAMREWLALGEKYETRNQAAQALQVYKHLRALLPAERESRRRLASLYEADGNRGAMLTELRELAQLATAQNEFEEAAAHWQKLLSCEPQDEAALQELAMIWRTLDRGDELFAALGTLGRIYCANGRHAEALTNLEALRTLRPDEPELLAQSIELLIQTGKLSHAAQQGIDLIQIYFGRQDDHHAMETLHRIAEIEPGNIERRISLARLVQANGREAEALQEFFLSATKLFGENQSEGALHVCEAGLQTFPDDVRLRDLMGRALLKLGRMSEAIEVQLHLAALYDERGEEGKAQRVYETILADQPDHQATLEAMVDWAVRHEKNSVAVEHLVALAEAHYLGGNLPDAITAMERVQALDGTRLDLRGRLAEVYFEAGDAPKALACWLATAQDCLAGGQPETAIELFERLRANDADNLEALAGLVQAHAALGHAEEHKHEALALAARYHADDRTPEALELLESLTEHYPGDPQAWQQLSAMYAARNAVVPAVRAYRRLAQVHQAARHLDAARQAYHAALELDAENIELIEELGDLCLQLGRRPEGIEQLGRAAQLLMDQGEWERARTLAERLLKLDPLNLGTRRLLAEAMELLGDRSNAIHEFIQSARGYAEAHQNGPALSILQHVLTLETQRVEERELYARLLHREGRTEESIEQYLLLLDAIDENEDPRRTIKYCRLILTEQPDHPAAHRHLCEVYERTDKLRQAFKECEWLAAHYAEMGAPHEAEQYLRKALEWFPEELQVRTQLVETLETMGQTLPAAQQLAELAAQAEARADSTITQWALEKACALEPQNLEHPRRLADYMERQGDAEGARQVRLRLTRQLLDNGQMEEARTMAERLSEGQDDTELRMALAEMFQQAGLPEVAAYHYHHLARKAQTAAQYEEAKAWARQALALKPRHVGAREILIEALRAQGENNAAVQEYQALVELYQSAGEFESALTTLQALVDLTPSAPEPRRQLIELYRRMRRDEALVEQLRKLAEIFVNAGDYAQAATCLRDLMQERPDDTYSRVRYIDLYTQLGDESDLKDDYLQLARIFARKGAVVEATHTYEKLVATHPNDMACREMFVQFLFEQGQVHRAVDETRLLADKLEADGKFQETGRALDRALNFAPEELDLRQRLAGIYLRTNRRGLALETFRSLARIYEQQGHDDRLVEVFQQIVAIDALNVEFRQRLADLLQRRGEIDEACEQFKQLAGQYLERGLFDLAEHEFRRILEMHPDDATLWEQVIENHLQIGTMDEVVPDLMMLAEIYLGQGRMKDAVNTYHKILECEPDNLDILRRYIDVYQQIGLEQDLVDDYLRLADLRVQRGEVGEAIRLFKHLMEVKPNDPSIRERLSATQRLGTMPQDGMSGTTLKRMENGKQIELMKVIRNYQNVLKLNPNNPTARVKLAELYEHAGDTARADEHWALASESYLGKGDLLRCIEISERYLQRHPEDSTMRERLSTARVQHDSMRAIDGAISRELDQY